MRRLAAFAGSFSLGVFLAQYVLRGGWILAGAGLALALGFLSKLLPWEWRRRGVILCAALALGLGWSWLYARQVQRPAQEMAGRRSDFTATLCGYAEETDFGARAEVRVEGVPGKAVLYAGEELLDLAPGQTVAGQARFNDAARVRDEDITAFTSKGVFLLAYARGNLETGEGTRNSPRWLPARMGRAMRERIQVLFPGDAAGFLTAVLTGDRGGISEKAYTALAEAGLNHILAVSGMHCGFLMALAGFLLQSRKLQALLGIPLLAFYAVLTGGSPSVLRACVMLSLPLLAILARRESDGPTSLLAALFLILLANPFAAVSVSLQLSFAAMAGILWLTPRLRKGLVGEKKRGKTWGRLFRFLALAFSTSMGAMVFTVPLTAYYFGALVLIAPLSSALCLWAAAWAFSFGLLSVFVSFFYPPLGALLALPARLAAEYILLTAGLLSRIPCHAVYTANPYLKYWIVYAYCLFAAAYLARRTGRRKYVLASALAALTLALTLRLGAARYGSDLDALVLDVGQGQSVVLASEGTFALVDCGSANSWKDPGAAAARQLAAMGCERLDYLLLTHYDKDHVSGVTGLLDRLDVDTLLLPEGEDDAGPQEAVLSAAGAHGAAVRFITAEERLDFGRGTLTVYPPVGDAGDNERGLSVLASAGENDLLITGDMDAATEKKLLETFDLPDIEALVAGHHGSKYATSQALLDAVRPETACISVGSNSYGHPTEETLLRLARQGCGIYRTDLHGTIHLSWNQEESHG
ncbi:DNA internalization-related competence protein ComEC/Rec2 [uncultured Oscillibacter sp.]|uniref:DNA internalization-related competence protein ComEC/Rec2 n=1 Tax=uncultured Oscillibacter sp. TaxID=876091 RepID=UPI00272A6817|nr:DNA internalization-related competence protein ComEC/Rec2 [uncultured Oscillibacter sp.]